MGLLWSNQLETYQDSMTDTLALTTLPAGDNDALEIQVSQYPCINKKNRQSGGLRPFRQLLCQECGGRQG